MTAGTIKAIIITKKLKYSKYIDVYGGLTNDRTPMTNEREKFQQNKTNNKTEQKNTVIKNNIG